jgi:hypothetical protein
MIEALDNRLRTGFEDLPTGDESWMTGEQNPTRMCALESNCVDESRRPTAHCQKTIIPVSCGIDGITL